MSWLKCFKKVQINIEDIITSSIQKVERIYTPIVGSNNDNETIDISDAINRISYYDYQIKEIAHYG